MIQLYSEAQAPSAGIAIPPILQGHRRRPGFHPSGNGDPVCSKFNEEHLTHCEWGKDFDYFGGRVAPCQM